MWVCDLLKSSTTLASMGSCVLSSPVPRQQYHLISTGGPLGAAVPLAPPLAAFPPLQAVISIAMTMITPEYAGIVLRIWTTSCSRFRSVAWNWPWAWSAETGKGCDAVLPSFLASAETAYALQSGHHRFRVAWLPAGAHHDALHVIAGSIAPDEGPGVLDGAAVGRECDALHQQGRCSRSLAKDARLTRLDQHRLERFAGAQDSRPVPVREQVGERVRLQVGGQQAREALRGEVDELKEERRAGRQ